MKNSAIFDEETWRINREKLVFNINNVELTINNHDLNMNYGVVAGVFGFFGLVFASIHQNSVLLLKVQHWTHITLNHHKQLPSGNSTCLWNITMLSVR